MSGHSKWAQIKRKKEITDKKKGLIFGRLSREILRAADALSRPQGRKNGTDPAMNTALRDSLARARAVNMPQVNIDRLLDRSADKQMKEVIYEGFGPSGVALLIVALTDNTNRTVQTIRSILKNHHGSLATPGAVRWKFTHGKPNHPLTLTPATRELVRMLLTELQEHPDIADITTDAVE